MTLFRSRKKGMRRVLQARCDSLNVARREIGALGDQLAAVKGRFERAADRTCAVVIAEQIEVTAIIGIAELSGGLGITADADADFEERLVGKRLRREVDDAAAKPARIIGRISILEESAAAAAGREEKNGREHVALQSLMRVTYAV